MATFIEIVRSVARESGTVPDLNSPATTVAQTGRLARFVHWTRDAYSIIQRKRPDWNWLRADFQGSLLPSVREYDSTALSIAARFDHFVMSDESGSVTLWRTSDGQAAEGFLIDVPWERFRRHYLIGSAAADTGKPSHVSRDPMGRLVFWPLPDAACTVRGEYIKAPQELTADSDIPELPIAHHDAIKFQALILMAIYDEAAAQEPYWQRELQAHMSALLNIHTPRFSAAWPMA